MKSKNISNYSSLEKIMSQPELLQQFSHLVSSEQGQNRVWAYRNYCLVENGFLSSDELIDHSISIGFKLYDPFTRIRRGTKIEKDVLITEGTVIEGQDIIIRQGTILNGAQILGNNIVIGRNNKISGKIEIDNFTTDSDNVVDGILGKNEGKLTIGSDNLIKGINIYNVNDGFILIGNNNKLFPALSMNIPFPQGSILIGNHNSLGRDGGGVISSSYRFGRKWNGHVIIGNFVETTRGAEILGFSLLGYSQNFLDEDEDTVAELFTKGKLHQISKKFQLLRGEYNPSILAEDAEKSKSVSLFGTVNTKRCFLTGRVTIKDDSKIQSSYLRDVLVAERCKIYNSAIIPNNNRILSVTAQDCAVENRIIHENQNWQKFPRKLAGEQYPISDADFYKDWDWDKREGKIIAEVQKT